MADNTSLVRKQLEESLQSGSLKSLAREYETLMLLIDTSGSMDIADVGSMRRRRIDALRDVVKNIRSEGSIPMIAFGGPYDCEVRFVDVVPEPDGGTPLHSAIKMAKQYGATRVVIISDGQPDLPGQCTEEAKTFGGQLDVVYVGPKEDGGSSLFLEELAKVTGGKRIVGDLSDVNKLTSHVIALLDGEVEDKPIIQGDGFTTTDAPEETDDADDDDTDDDEEEDDDENDEEE